MRTKVILFVLPAILTASLGMAQQNSGNTLEAWSKISPSSDNEIFKKIEKYRKDGDFERAVAVALTPVGGRQPDDFLLQTTAYTYFQRAQSDAANKEKWVALAVQYSERALAANPNDLVNVFNLGESYSAAGMNLGKPTACPYYEKSLQTFDRLKADRGLQGEWGTIEGERVQLAPYRKKLDEHIKTVRMLGARCPGL